MVSNGLMRLTLRLSNVKWRNNSKECIWKGIMIREISV